MSPTAKEPASGSDGTRRYPRAPRDPHGGRAATADRGEEDSLERQMGEGFPFDAGDAGDGPVSASGSALDSLRDTPRDTLRDTPEESSMTDGEIEAAIPTAPSTDDDREPGGHLP